MKNCICKRRLERIDDDRHRDDLLKAEGFKYCPCGEPLAPGWAPVES